MSDSHLSHDSPARKPVIGLLGGIGSGKSTVAAEFAALGCEVIDADKIGHELLQEPQIKQTLRERWGEAIFDGRGEVDRRLLGAKVFEDPQALAQLNALLHPGIASRIGERIEATQADPHAAAAVLDAAVMLEAGWDRFCTDLVFVRSPESVRAQRVSTQRRWGAAAWRARENSQISLDKKALRCKYVIDNSSNVSSLREQVRTVYNKILSSAGECRR